jgi:hypothetical protein
MFDQMIWKRKEKEAVLNSGGYKKIIKEKK